MTRASAAATISARPPAAELSRKARSIKVGGCGLLVPRAAMPCLSYLLYPAGFARGNLAPCGPIAAMHRMASGGPIVAGCLPDGGGTTNPALVEAKIPGGCLMLP